MFPTIWDERSDVAATRVRAKHEMGSRGDLHADVNPDDEPAVMCSR